MNPNLCHVVLRERDPLDVLDLTFAFVRVRWRPLGRLFAAYVLPVVLLIAPLVWVTGGHPAWFGVAIALGPLLQAPFTNLAGRLLFTEDSAIAPCFADWGAQLPTWVATRIALLGCWGVIGFTCLLGAPFLLPAVVFLPETVLLERCDARRALRRAARLAGGQLVRGVFTAGAQWGLVLYGLLAGEVLGWFFVSELFPTGGGPALLDGVASISAVAGVIAVQPLIAVYRLMLYVDVRTREEGWDLQVELRALRLVEEA